jgi:hypothetical protein
MKLLFHNRLLPEFKGGVAIGVRRGLHRTRLTSYRLHFGGSHFCDERPYGTVALRHGGIPHGQPVQPLVDNPLLLVASRRRQEL